MIEIDFNIADWLGASIGEPLERETLASLQIKVGPNSIPVTEVEDTIAQTVRRHINVPANSLARWLLVNWWRLRWEPGRSSNPPFDWLRSHSMAAIGGDYAWPALTFSSDGEFIQLQLQAETSPDVSALRYLRDITIDVPASDFEQSVEQFLGQVEARLALRVPANRELSELKEELNLERRDAATSAMCKLQALAGIDPGSASEEWLRVAEGVVVQAGAAAADEILAVAPILQGGLKSAEAIISEMRHSGIEVKLDWAVVKQSQTPAGEVPWKRGARLAGELRTQLGIPSGPLTNDTLADLLAAKLPLSKSTWTGPRQLRGGYRDGGTQGRTAVLVTTHRVESQRFYLARLIGAALRASADQHVLPVSDALTAFQKFERSFAQELLCPWRDLDAFTDQSGTDDEGIADAASHFAVSEQVVRSTLVNKDKIPRSRLQP